MVILKKFIITKNQKKMLDLKYFGLTIIIYILINLSFSKEGLLNNIIFINSKHYRAGSFAFNSNGDMVIEYSYHNFRLFYGLKKNGKGYFKDSNNNETSFKEISIENDETNNRRFESKSLFVHLVNDSSKKEYYFSTGSDESITELINLETGEYKIIGTSTFFGYKIYSFAFSLLSNENQNLYFAIFLTESNKNCEIKKLSFTNFEVNNKMQKTIKTISTNSIHRAVNGFIFGEKLIIFYLGDDKNYYININNYDYTNFNNDIKINSGDLWIGYGLFFKGIHIKDQLIGFMYYKIKSNTGLEMRIGNINNDTFYTKFYKSFESYSFYIEEIMNDFIKINDERLAFLGVIVDNPNRFKIFTFDFYNNYEYMKIRVYDLELSYYKINKELALTSFNNYLVLSSTALEKDQEDTGDNNDSNNEIRISFLIFFGYVNGTDKTIDITDYLKDDYINSCNNIVNQLTENIQIDNNIFGYIVITDQIKLSLIPNEILFYNISNENSSLSNGSILDKNYNFIQNIELNKTNEYYSLDYQIIIQEPDYATFDNMATEIINMSSVDQKEYFNQRMFYGRANTIKFKLCYEYCATCKKIGLKISDQKCETCLDEYNFYYYNDTSNCVEEGYFIDKENNRKEQCNNTNSKFYIDLKTGKRICFKNTYDCPPSYPYFNSSTNECHNRAHVCTYLELLNNFCSFKEYNNTEIYYKLKNEVIFTYPSEDGESLVIEGKENYVFQLTSEENEKDSMNGNYDNNYNLSMIDLNICESILKLENKLNQSMSLIFLKFEKLTGIAAEKNVQFEVYEPINKTKLDLSVCNRNSINIYLPISLKEKTEFLLDELQEYGYDLLNINDSFYHDICTKFKSENGTDVILSDRKTDYYTNESTCQANCIYSEYSSETKFLKCECIVNDEEIVTVNMDKFNGKIFFESFYEVLKYSNYKVVKCYKLVFNINSISKNLGSIVVIVYFAIYLPFACLFAIKGLSPIKIDGEKAISDNISQKKTAKISGSSDNKPINENKNEGLDSSQIKINNHKRSNKKRITKNSKEIVSVRDNEHRKIHFPPKRGNNLSKSCGIKINSDKSIDNNTILNKKSFKKVKFRTRTKKNNIKRESFSKDENKNSVNSNVKILNKRHKTDVQIFKTKKDKEKEKKEGEKLDDYQLNDLNYLEAIEKDKRPFSQIYWATLKRNQIILFTFFSWKDYNIYYVKFARFIFLICTDMAMNVIFFSDDSMHKVYLNYGKYNFIQQIPQILYSTIFSQILEVFLCFLSMTDKHIYQIKELKKETKNEKEILKVIKCIKIKLICFYLFISVIFAFYWYLIASFCAVYENTQVIFIKDSISCFITGLIYPFVLYLLPPILRVIALKDKKKNSKCIYKLSDIVPFF